MLPLLTFPLALVGLAALPTLAAIYWLRNRFRRQPVSSLMLWADHREIREGGTRKHRLQTPFVFYLELLALLLLAVAAAGPHLQTTPGSRPLLVVLDDSYSMTAGGDDSPRQRALATLEKELRDRSYASVGFLLSGNEPQILSDAAQTSGKTTRLVQEWKCRSPRSRIDDALALASELAGDHGLILVLTDQKPETEPGTGKIMWRSFGSPKPNVAFVNAARTARDGAERCLLEIANLSDETQSTVLRITVGEPAEELQQIPLTLAPQETRRIILDIKDGTPVLAAYLGPDDLEIDNRVILLPATVKPMRIDVQIQNKALREIVEKAVRAAPGAEISGADPHLFITDRDGLRTDNAWLVQIIAEIEAEAYTGPFIMDRVHPLTQGLDLQGIVWGAGKTVTLTGSPVIMAGNVPLIGDSAGSEERHDVRIRLRPDLSTLPESPNWPILWWNLIQWRASAEPGLSRVNVRLGENTTLTLPATRESVHLVDPDGKSQTLNVPGRRVAMRANTVGVHRVAADENRYTFASNTLNADESDLRSCVSGRWGDWLDETTLKLEYQNIAWALLLLALGILTLHAFLIARNNRRAST